MCRINITFEIPSERLNIKDKDLPRAISGEFTFSYWGYYGYDGSLKNNGYNAAINIKSFVNPVTVLNLEQWNNIVNAKETFLEKDLNFYRINAEEDYLITPISVLRYISELEKTINKKQDERDTF